MSTLSARASGIHPIIPAGGEKVTVGRRLVTKDGVEIELHAGQEGQGESSGVYYGAPVCFVDPQVAAFGIDDPDLEGAAAK